MYCLLFILDILYHYY